jgi:ornithine cyclodeaminase
MTLLLGADDLRSLIGARAGTWALRDGFAASPAGPDAQRIRQALPAPGSIAVLLPGLLPGIPAYTVKVNAKYPGSSPAIRGVICLHDLRTGELLALLDSGFITAWRTGLSAALATHLLARADAPVVGVIGAGAQARVTMHGLASLRAVERVAVYDIDSARAARAAGAWKRAGLACSTAGDVREVLGTAGVIVTATWSRSPLFEASQVRPGTHVTSLGADEPGKNELDPQLLRQARLFVDDIDLAASSGALAGTGLEPGDVAGTLSQVITGAVPGRTDAAEVTVYSPVGMPWQDLALSWAAYHAASQTGAGTNFEFQPAQEERTTT